jgi:hypothetical protein
MGFNSAFKALKKKNKKLEFFIELKKSREHENL